MKSILLVGAGGFIGAVLRYLIGLLPLGHSDGFPVKTLIINVVGAFAIGLITALAAKRGSADSALVLMLRVGVCGGFTTFSTFAFESVSLMQDGKIWTAAAYMLLSMILCCAAIVAAQMIVQ